MTRIRLRPEQIVSRKIGLLTQNIQGRASASSTSLAQSYDLPIDRVRTILRTNGVQDDG